MGADISHLRGAAHELGKCNPRLVVEYVVVTDSEFDEMRLSLSRELMAIGAANEAHSGILTIAGVRFIRERIAFASMPVHEMARLLRDRLHEQYRDSKIRLNENQTLTYAQMLDNICVLTTPEQTR